MTGERSPMNWPVLIAVVVIIAVTLLTILFLVKHSSLMNTWKTGTSSHYAWQNTCNDDCAKTIGTTMMQEIDGSDCATLHLSLVLMKNAQEYNQLGGSGSTGDWQTSNRILALGDRSASLHCQ